MTIEEISKFEKKVISAYVVFNSIKDGSGHYSHLYH